MYSGSLFNPSWFALYSSRGLDDPALKIYMRATVLVSEYLLYIPASTVLLRWLSRLEGVHTWDCSIALVALFMQPATLLIDHAHFQYNTVMLGFVLSSMASLMAGKILWGCVFFVAALGFKQMALYYAPAVFAYLLGICIFPRLRLERLFYIALVTMFSFALLFAPLILGAFYDARRGIPSDPEAKDSIPTTHPLLSSLPLPAGLRINPANIYYPPLHQLAQSIHRIFPFARGLFEDKVANFWCTLNLIIKFRHFPTATLQRLSLLATLAAIAPPCTILFFKPKKQLLSLALATTAWGFFLCSFQVHEKSVLLPLLPMTVLLAADGGLTPSVRAWVGWANILGAWTMFPLLKRDDLRIPYYVLTLLWAYILGLPPTSLSLYSGRRRRSDDLQISTRVLHLTFYIMMIAWHVTEGFVEPPKGLPDLWVVLNVVVGTVGFGISYLWCLWRLAALSGLIESPEARRKTGDKSKQRAA
jgi:alpha-1,3-glucosyltransferase